MVAISGETPIFATTKPLTSPVTAPVSRATTMETTSDRVEFPPVAAYTALKLSTVVTPARPA